MAAVAPQPPVEAPSLPAVRARSRPQPERRPHVAGGVAWIVVIGVMLAGVVFLNVAVLRLNMRLDKQGRERTTLRNDIQSLSSQLSSAQAAGRIQAQAHKDLGLIPADAAGTTFVTLPK